MFKTISDGEIVPRRDFRCFAPEFAFDTHRSIAVWNISEEISTQIAL